MDDGNHGGTFWGTPQGNELGLRGRWTGSLSHPLALDFPVPGPLLLQPGVVAACLAACDKPVTCWVLGTDGMMTTTSFTSFGCAWGVS